MRSSKFLRYFERDPFKTLGVEKNATEAEIRHAFRKLSIKYHPDRNKSSDAIEYYQKISAAYDLLKDPHRRADTINDMNLYNASNDDSEWTRRSKRNRSNSNSSGFNYNNVQSDFDYTEAQARKNANKTYMRNMYTFESLVHPKILFGVLPLLGIAYYFISNTINPANKNMYNDKDALIDAWYNPVKERWETPAPWDENFDSSNIQKQRKSQVVDSNLP